MTRVLLAGDHFIRADALAREISTASPNASLDVQTLLLPWPNVPFSAVAEVDEASGSEDEMIAAIKGVEICVTQMAPFTRRVIEAADALKLICVTRGGPVNVNLEAARARGIAVCPAPGRNAAATAEHTIALLLAALRNVPARHSEILEGQWRSDYYGFDQVGFEIGGSTTGLVGYGAVGRLVARMLQGFGAKVMVYDPFAAIDPADGVDQEDDLHRLLAASRIVSLHARLTKETRGMIGAPQIAAMPRGGVLVNAARGALLDYDAACDALQSGHLASAAFDVFPEEPLPTRSRLRTTPNIVMTPHLAGATKETALRAARIAAGQVAAYLAGQPLPFRIGA
ncbi:MAG TPA: 2-hydroxyacid dehydrogenase [Nitrobacter sp.]|nr:2-hydroxyacid dehydrogenase [Nitrobacter sp.]